MSDERDQRQDIGSRTGEMPPVRDQRLPHEPPMPDQLPEFTGTDGATGRFRVVSEGEDRTRDHDDSGTRSISAPAPKPARTGKRRG